MKQFFVTLIILIAILIAITTSFITLFPQSIRLDEAQSIWVYTKPIPAFLKLTAEDVLVPLYGIILHFWMQIFGTNISVVRILSMIFFLLTIPVVYKFAEFAGNKKIAIVAVVLFSFSPFLIWYSSESRMYTLFLFITTLNNYFFFKLYKSDGISGKVGFFLSAVAGLYTHYFFLFQLATQGIFVFAKAIGLLRSIDDFNFAPTTSSWFRYRRLAFIYLSLLCLVALSIAPWISYVFYLGSLSNSVPYIQAPTTFNIFQVFVQFLSGFQDANIQGILISLWPLLILLIVILFTQKQQLQITNLEYFLLITFLPVALVFLVSFIRPIFLARYLIFITPTLFILLATILLSYSRRISYSAVCVVVLLMFALMVHQNVSAETPVKEDYQTAAKYLTERIKPQDIVAVSSPFTIYPIEYYYSGTAKITTIPEWNRFANGPIPPYSEQKFIDQMEENKRIYNYIYIVLSYNQGYENKIIQYMDTHYQRLEVKKISPGLQIRSYRMRYN